MIEIHLIKEGKKPEFKQFKENTRKKTFDTWIRGRGLDLIVVFGASYEDEKILTPILIPAIRNSTHGRIEWMNEVMNND